MYHISSLAAPVEVETAHSGGVSPDKTTINHADDLNERKKPRMDGALANEVITHAMRKNARLKRA
eukprot:1083833-Pyramimonas_sp.AAC.1